MLRIYRLDGTGRCFLVALLLAGAGLMAGASDLQARSSDRAVIRLSCPASPQRRDPLCQAMIQTLAHVTNGPTVIRPVARGDEAPTRPGDLGIALHVTERESGGLAGRLVWQKGRDGPRQTGPVHRMILNDAVFSPKVYEQFTKGLLKATRPLQAALMAR